MIAQIVYGLKCVGVLRENFILLVWRLFFSNIHHLSRHHGKNIVVYDNNDDDDNNNDSDNW